MNLGNGYHITSDKYQYIVEKHSIYKDGKNVGEEYVTNVSYHPTVLSACNWILRQLQRGEILADDPTEVSEAFRRAVEAVKGMLEKCEHLEIGETDDKDISQEKAT